MYIYLNIISFFSQSQWKIRALPIGRCWWLLSLLLFFFYQGFLSRTLTIHRTAGEGRGPFSIPLYHFHPLTNIQTFMRNFARKIFLIATLVFTRLLLNEIYHLIELLCDWLMMWHWFKFICLFIWFKVLLQLFDMREAGGLELASTITFVLQANRLTKCASVNSYIK